MQHKSMLYFNCSKTSRAELEEDEGGQERESKIETEIETGEREEPGFFDL
jgi:hypothetical protein